MPTAQDLEKVFAKLDDVAGKISTGGCTAIVAVVKNGHLCVANAGDARAVLIRKVCFCLFSSWFFPLRFLPCQGKATRISVDHRTTLASERDRIRKDGGFILSGRVSGIIEVTRALGDALIPLCIALPTVRDLAIEQGDVLVMGCDGVFDELSDDMVANIVSRRPDPMQAALMLRDEAFYLGSTDNISAACIKL